MSVEAKTRIEFNATRFGVVEIDEDQVLTFVDAILGFPEAERFVLIPHKESSSFAWLQSVDIPDLAFLVTDPWLFFKNYNPVITEAELEGLAVQIADEDSFENIVVVSILTIPSEPEKITANLQAPVIINTGNNTAKQVILPTEEYTTKHKLLPDS
ncbi:MAG TPA: flagellar assembly protein FliW [Candidatus Aquicultor sp.]